ncbi:MAG: hypothetical protein ACRDT0_07460 [Pseudonocardiaceae bacterium]
MARGGADRWAARRPSPQVRGYRRGAGALLAVERESGAPPARGRRDRRGWADDDHRPPVGIEVKGAVAALAPRPGVPRPDTGTVAPEGIVEMSAAVTGIRDEVGDVLVARCFGRSLAARRPRVCQAHQRDRPIGRLLDVKELLPGDPRLPTRTGDGRPWPQEAGALVCTGR